MNSEERSNEETVEAQLRAIINGRYTIQPVVMENLLDVADSVAAVERERDEDANDYKLDRAAWTETLNAVIARAERAESALDAALARIAAVEAEALQAIKNVPRRSGTAQWSSTAAGFDCGLAAASDAVASAFARAVLAASPTPTGPETREWCCGVPSMCDYGGCSGPGPATPTEPTEETP